MIVTTLHQPSIVARIIQDMLTSSITHKYPFGIGYDYGFDDNSYGFGVYSYGYVVIDEKSGRLIINVE